MKTKRIFFSLLVGLSSHLSPLAGDQIRAAFDVGSGQTKITIASVEESTGRPTKILFSEETVLLLGHDLIKNKNERLSDEILSKLEKLLTHYRDVAHKYGAEELAGVATAVFRKSKNGFEFIQRMASELGIRLQLITQAEEGRIGFLTAVAASGKEANRVVAWDSGGASFQIAAEKADSKLLVYEGPWGASKAVAVMVENVQGKDFAQIQTANPATLDQVIALQKIMQSSFQSAHRDLLKKIENPSSSIIAIGGPYSAFKMAALALGKESFTKEDLWSAITKLVERSDAELAQFSEPEMLIPRLTLIYSVMDYFDMKLVEYRPTTGGTLGILISPQFWQ